jgi:hypothetical protein
VTKIFKVRSLSHVMRSAERSQFGESECDG